MEVILVVVFITCCFSVSCGQTTGIDTSIVTRNSFVQETTEEFHRFCPTTKCVTDINKENDTDLDCCKQCICSNGCGLNCCPDKLFLFTNENDFYDANELIRCVKAQYIPSLDTSLSFEMVSNCPFNYADGKVVEQCRREYHEFDFQMPLRNFLPAYDQTSNRVYKNIFCAVCHNADINDLDFALLTSDCPTTPRNLTYLHDLAWNVSGADGNCNFRFSPRDIRWSECNSNYRTRCNVTGRWEKYDRQLEEKCLSYRSDYNGEDLAVYRNVHCFLCNGFSERDVITECPQRAPIRQPLNFYIDFKGAFSIKGSSAPYIPLNTDDNGSNLCQKETIYNTSQVQTWNLECPFGMGLSDYSCFPPSLPGAGSFVSMYVSLLLEPEHSQLNQRETSLFAFLSQISTEVQNIFSGLVTKNNLLDYNIMVSVDLDTLPTRNTTIDFDSIKEIPIHTNITLAGIKEAILPILDFSLLFNNITRMGDFKVKIRRQNPLAYDIKLSCLFHDYLPRNVLHCPDDAFNYHIRISGAKNSPSHYTTSAVVIGVEREPFCPRIALKKLAFVENTETCNDFHELSQIFTDEFLSKQLSENDTHIFFCFKDYLQHLENLKRQDVTHSGRNTKELAFIYFTIVCISASVLSLSITVIIYALFAVLRTLPGLNIMALSLTLLLYHTLSLVSTFIFVDIPWLCSLIGIVAHFFVIQSFCWMFICTFHMMKVFIRIRSRAVPENVSRTFIIYVICAALVATTLVAVTVIVAEVRSGGQDIGYGGNDCFIKDQVMIMCVSAIPVAFVVILNFCMFCVVLLKISRFPSLAASKQKERQNTVIFIKLSTLTGLSTVFGFVFYYADLYAFGYLYAILNGGQGVFIMISFIFNRRVRFLVHGLALECCKTGSSTVTTSI